MAFFDLIDTCVTGSWDTETLSDITQPVLGPLFTQPIPSFTRATATVNSVDCLSRTYTLLPALSFVTVDGTNLVISVQTTDLSQVGTYSG